MRLGQMMILPTVVRHHGKHVFSFNAYIDISKHFEFLYKCLFLEEQRAPQHLSSGPGYVHPPRVAPASFASLDVLCRLLRPLQRAPVKFSTIRE